MPAERPTRKKAIKEKCLDCSGGIKAEIRRCPAQHCPLWPFRMGTEIRSTGTDEADAEEQAEADPE